MVQGYAGFKVRGAYTLLIPLSHSPSEFRHWLLSEYSWAIWRSCSLRTNHRFQKSLPLRSKATGNPRGLHLTTESGTTFMRKTEALPSASCTRPCLPSQRPHSHGISMSRFVLTSPSSFSFPFIRSLDCKSILVCPARASISDYHGGCRIYYGLSPFVQLVCTRN